MARIDNFNEFRINEADESPRSKEALINVFFDTLQEVVEDSDMTSSYSTFAQGYSGKKGRHLDPEVDYNVMVAQFGRHGWTKKALENFFTKYGKEAVKRYNNGSDYGTVGHDIFMYYAMKGNPGKDFSLAGYDYAQAAKDQGAGEYWIKFGYGYQNTKYGQLAIKQQLGDLTAWYKLAYDLLQKTLFGTEEDMQSLGGEGTLKGTEWDTTKIKSLLKKGTAWDGKTTITMDLSEIEDNLGDEKFARFENDLKKQLGAIGFDFGMDDNYYHGGTGSVKRSVIKLGLVNNK